MGLLEGLGTALVVFLIFIVVIAVLLFGGLRTSIFFTVRTQEAVIVEHFGRFKSVQRRSEHQDAVH